MLEDVAEEWDLAFCGCLLQGGTGKHVEFECAKLTAFSAVIFSHNDPNEFLRAYLVL